MLRFEGVNFHDEREWKRDIIVLKASSLVCFSFNYHSYIIKIFLGRTLGVFVMVVRL